MENLRPSFVDNLAAYNLLFDQRCILAILFGFVWVCILFPSHWLLEKLIFYFASFVKHIETCWLIFFKPFSTKKL